MVSMVTNFKDMILSCGTDDTVYNNYPPGSQYNGLSNHYRYSLAGGRPLNKSRSFNWGNIKEVI